MQIRVKLENIDEEQKKYVYHTRMLRIKIGTSKEIKTPIRSVTNSEINAKAQIPAEVPIHADIGLVNIKLGAGSRRNIISFLRKNSVFNRVVDTAYYNLIKMQHFPISVVLVQPSRSAIQLLEEQKMKETFIRMVTTLQINLGLRIITIPWIRLTPQDLHNVVKDIKNEHPDLEVMPILDLLEPDYLEKYLKELGLYYKESQELQLLGVLYKTIDRNIPSYEVLWKNVHDKDIATFLIDVRRYGASNIVPEVASPHYAEFVFGDIIARYVPFAGGGSESSEKRRKREKPIDAKLKFFDKDRLTVEALRNIKERDIAWVEKIASTFGNEKTVIEALENYQEAQGNRKKMGILEAISKVHEYKESLNEFKKSQKFIEKGESMEYIDEKYALRRILSSKITKYR